MAEVLSHWSRRYLSASHVNVLLPPIVALDSTLLHLANVMSNAKGIHSGVHSSTYLFSQ